MEKMSYSVHQVLYLDNVCGMPQIGHFLTDDTNEANQTFLDNAHTDDLLDFADQMGKMDIPVQMCGLAAFMGKIPRILAN